MTATKTLYETVARKTKGLPLHKQQEVLDFIEFLKQKETVKKPLKRSRGLLADLKLTLSTEEIDEARKEMWGKFPRDDV